MKGPSRSDAWETVPRRRPSSTDRAPTSRCGETHAPGVVHASPPEVLMRLPHRRMRHSLLCIVPPHLLLHLARQTDPRLRAMAEAALQTLLVSERLRGGRGGIGGGGRPGASARG